MGKTISKKYNVSLKEFYKIVKHEIEGNNFNYKVTVSINDGANPVIINYVAPEGFAEDQTKRKGSLEIKTG